MSTQSASLGAVCCRGSRQSLRWWPMDVAVPRTRPGFRKAFSAIDRLVSVQKRAQLDWGKRLE